MKKPFNVVTLGELVSSSELELSLRSFAKFYHTLTAKHKKQTALTIITSRQTASMLQSLVEEFNISNAVCILNKQEKEIENVYLEANLMFLPTFQKINNIINEAFSYGLPVLVYHNPTEKEYIDNTCGLIVKRQSTEQSIEDFCKKMRMLYFDPEAQKILRKGAKRRYNNLVKLRHIERRLPLAS